MVIVTKVGIKPLHSAAIFLAILYTFTFGCSGIHRGSTASVHFSRGFCQSSGRRLSLRLC